MTLLEPAGLLLLATLILPAHAAQDLPAKAGSSSPAIEQAELLLSAGKIDEAINLLTAISRSESNGSQISHLLGLAYYQKADYARAVENLSAAAKRTPEGSRQ